MGNCQPERNNFFFQKKYIKIHFATYKRNVRKYCSLKSYERLHLYHRLPILIYTYLHMMEQVIRAENPIGVNYD